MPEHDLFGEPVRLEPEYQTARTGPAERMFAFPVTLPGQMALGAPEAASDAASCPVCHGKGDIPAIRDYDDRCSGARPRRSYPCPRCYAR